LFIDVSSVYFNPNFSADISVVELLVLLL
jgi:hypothetical protein